MLKAVAAGGNIQWSLVGEGVVITLACRSAEASAATA